jgi:uncharacterized iron-regulated membrane protein
MRTFIHRAHVWLGVVAAVPVLAWATSGLLYSLPRGVVEGGRVEAIDAARVRVSAPEALARAGTFAGRSLPITALTLLVRDGRPVYQAVGGMGADSLLIDAETGDVTPAPPPGALTRYFRQAHFYYFAGAWQVPLLIISSALATFSALSGIYLNVAWWRARLRKDANQDGRRAAGDK